MERRLTLGMRFEASDIFIRVSIPCESAEDIHQPLKAPTRNVPSRRLRLKPAFSHLQNISKR